MLISAPQTGQDLLNFLQSLSSEELKLPIHCSVSVDIVSGFDAFVTPDSIEIITNYE